MAVDESKLNVFMQNFVRDLGAVMHEYAPQSQRLSLTEEQAMALAEDPFNLIFEARP